MSHRILFLGPAATESGWGVACREYIRALETFTKDIHVVDRYLGGGQMECPPDINKYINNRMPAYDYFIQMGLPNHLYKEDRDFKKSLGIVFSECHYSKNSKESKLALSVDELMVATDWEANMWNSICRPEHAVAIGCPVRPLDHSQSKDVRPQFGFKSDDIVFYAIAEDVPRKNLRNLIKIFAAEFTSEDQVRLVLKTNKDMSEECQKLLQTQGANYNTKKAPYITLVNERISDQDILDLHHSFDVYLNASHSEGWCLPAADAVSSGNYLVGSKNFLEDFGGPCLYDDRLDCCMLTDDAFSRHYGIDSLWGYPNYLDLKVKMRHAYDLAKKSPNGNKVELQNCFSYHQVGQNIRKCL